MSTAWTGRRELNLDLVTEISQDPGIYVRANIKAVPTFTARTNENVIRKSGGGADIYRKGRDEVDISLRAPFIDRATMELLEEIRERGLQVYLYAVPFGSCQLYAPLNKGTGGDPVAGTYTNDVTSLSTLYMLEADSRRGVYLRATTEPEPPLKRGIYTSLGVMEEFALGRGLYFPKNELKNILLNGELDFVTAHEPVAWNASGGAGGVDYGVKEPGPNGVNAIWMKTSAGTLNWTSNAVVVGGAYSPGDILCFAYGFRGDGQIRASLNWNIGGSLNFDETAGTGWSVNQIVVPDVGGGAVPTNFTISFTMQLNGDYFEIFGPGVYQLGAAFAGDLSYITQPVLGSSATPGFVTDYSLYYDTELGVDLNNGNDTVVCASGIMQPGWPGGAGDNEGPRNVIAQFENQLTGNTVEGWFHDPNGTGLFLSVTEDGAGGAQTSAMTHTLGKQWAWILYSGLNGSGVYTIGVKICEVGTTTVYTAQDLTGVTPNFYFDRLWIGSTATDSDQFDGIIGGVQAYASTFASLDTDLQAMASRDVLDIHRRTNGRLYRISNLGLSPHRLDRQHWSGTISLEEVKAI